MSRHKRLPDPEESWAQVELWRWQHGELPGPGDMRPLNVSEGLRGMAAAIETRDMSKFPSPFNVMTVLRYAAKLLEKQGQESAEGAEDDPWLPMVTAPKDGTKILALLSSSDVPQTVFYKERYGWKIAWDGYDLSEHDGPTRWMSIPSRKEGA
jgi:hypothetical protein